MTASVRARTRVAVPAPADGTQASWARAVGGIDPTRTGAYAIAGAWLERGAPYDLPTGILVILADKWAKPDRWHTEVALCRVDDTQPSGLEVLKTWVNRRGKFGPQIVNGITTRWKKHKGPVSADDYAPAVPRPNIFAGACTDCGTTVPAHTGVAVRIDGRRRARHLTCPPRSNDWPGACVLCSGWIQARVGIITRASDLGQTVETFALPEDHLARIRSLGGGWRLLHRDSCPPDPAPRPEPSEPPVNRRPGPCEICWGHIRERAGILVGQHGDRHLIHQGSCPTHPFNPGHSPTWQIAENDPRGDGTGLAYDYPAGVIARVTLRDGPADGPGWRIMANGDTSLIGVVITSIPRRTKLTTVWRVAEPDEAAPILDREAARLEHAGLTGRARDLLAILPGASPADATAPPEQDLNNLILTGTPTVSLPLGATRPETRIHLDGTTLWTIVANNTPDDDWNLSNYGGAIAYRHPLTPERAALLADLRAHHTKGLPKP